MSRPLFACALVALALFLTLLPAWLSAGPAAPSESTPDTPVVRRARELIATINAGDRAAAEQFVRDTYAPEFLEMPMDVHLGFIAHVRDQTRGLEFVGVEPGATDAEATVLARRRITGDTMALMVKVEPNPPHRIAAIGRKAPSAGGAAPGQPPRGITPEQLTTELDAFLTKLTENDLFSGVVLLADGDRPMFLDAYGPAHRDFDVPNRTDTKFNLGSMNKMFTAVAVAQLAEQGKLSLDDGLSKYLPEFPSREAAGKIRIKHLLTHTSGLGNYFNETFQQTSRLRMRDIDDLLEIAKQEPSLAFEPGERWAYSNTGYLVLGKVIEVVSGQDYHDYVREHIATPAGMTGTDSYELDKVNSNLAVGYHKNLHDDGTHHWTSNTFEHVIRGGPAGGGYSTAEDLMRFAHALRTGKLLGPEMTEAALSPKPELNSPEYGYGFQIDPRTGMVGHTGGFPGISTALFFRPQGGPTIVVLSNMSGSSMPVLQKIEDLASGLGAP